MVSESRKPEFCEKCRLDRIAGGAVPLREGDETHYSVLWKCPKCLGVSADMCPIGPLIPKGSTCLNCGYEYGPQEGDPVCGACGLRKSEAVSFLEIDPSTDSVKSAKAFFERGRIRSGIGNLNYKLLQEPLHEEAWVLKCWLLGEIRFFSSILQALKVIFPQGVQGELLFSQAFALQGLGKHREAIAVYAQYLAFNKAADRQTVGLGNMANSMKALGDIAGAEETYKRALKSEAAVTAVYCNYSRLLLDQRRWNEALNVIGDGLKRCPRDSFTAQLFADQAYVLAEENRGEASLEAAQKAIALDGGSLRNNYLLGRALALVGRLHDARRQITRVLEMDPQNQDARRALAMLDQALSGEKAKRWWEFWK